MDQLELIDLAAKYKDLGVLVCLPSAPWSDILGKEWTEKHAEVPVFLSEEDFKEVNDKQGMEYKKLAVLVEEFLSDERVFMDRSAATEEVKFSYRLLLSGFHEQLPARIDARLRSSVEDPEALLPAAVLALNLWSEDPCKDPEAWFLWFMAGSSYLRMKIVSKAVEYLQQAVELNPTGIEAMGELALSFALQHEYGKAEQLYKKVLEQVPDDFKTLTHLGALCMEDGRRVEALGFLEKALTLNPEDPQAETLRAMALKLKEKPAGD